MRKSLIMILFLLCSTPLLAQETLLEKSITLRQTIGTVRELLEALSRQNGFTFSYSNQLSLNRSVKVQRTSQPLRAHLEDIFAGQQVQYLVRGNKIILRPLEKATGKANTHTISGYVREKGSQELLPGVNVYLSGGSTGTTTNQYGFYSLTLPESDSLSLSFSFVGYQAQTRMLALRQGVELNVDLQDGMMLGEVEVLASGAEMISETPQMSTIEVPVTQIKKVPALLGEKDVLKVLQLMPGVQKGNEGNSGIYVRGGGSDQNLIILDDAVVYNAFHLFGFFSVFNGDALKSVELTKGGFPARYGGRLSSVIEMNMKEGNKEKLHGEGGIGLISSRLTLEGPLKKNKSSFLISGRRTYVDAFMRPLMSAGNKAGYYFYDLNTKLNYEFGAKNKLYVSGYFGRDKFSVGDKVFGSTSRNGFNWGNATTTLRWNHLFNQKLFANASFIFSNYRFEVFSREKDAKGNTYSLDYSSTIRDFGLKYDLDYFASPNLFFKVGTHTTFHRFTPDALVIKESDLERLERNVVHTDAVESAVYVESTSQPIARLRMNTGLRISFFRVGNKTYLNPEPRFSASYSLWATTALKASYATMNQYLHLLSSTGIGLPTDLWVPATESVAPQRSRQVALGLAKDITGKSLTATLELYYKKMDNTIAYKEGASFLVISEGPERAGQVNWEDNIATGQGWSYGAEWLLQKKAGKLSGWIGYTLSWTQLQFDSLNFGEKFYARHDRRHDLSLVGIYELSPKITLSGTWVYGTGSAMTMPVAQYYADQHEANEPGGVSYGYEGGDYTNDYGKKNSERMAPYHRMDIGIGFHKKKKKYERTWEFSIYNVYNRQNPYYYKVGSKIDTATGTQKSILKQVSLFPILPSFSYNFKF
jgi:hypothetical protein